ncbi:MAG: TetR/AcrR family transcriptional regulator [Myxococcales bacterium]
MDAAARVVRRDGSACLTLDAVAAESATSKGGVLYHFPSKEALVAALVERLVRRFEARLTGPADGMLERYVRASLEEADPADEALSASLVAAVAHAPALLEPFRKRYSEWDRALEACTGDRTTALLVRLALDGLWYADLLDMAPPSDSDRAKLADRLLAIAQPEPKPRTPPRARASQKKGRSK